MVRREETAATHLFKLAINNDGVVRGNYYNAVTDSAEPLAGSVDRKTQRAVWTVGGRSALRQVARAVRNVIQVRTQTPE
jgi:hypothetical protein